MTFKTKYEIGNIVFLLVNNKVVQRTIIGIKIKQGKTLFEDTKAISKIVYNLNSEKIGDELSKEEFEIFLTKTELLNSL